MRPFSLDRLHTLLTEAPKHTFWRHDVDFSLDAALEMGQFEAERGITATFYLFSDPKCPFYSPEDAFSAMLELSLMGHYVGAHVDERRPRNLRKVLKQGANRVSFHCPTDEVLWRDFEGFENAYSSAWKGRYYADSGGIFRFGDPEDHPRAEILQINLHPEWWVMPEWLSYVDSAVYDDFFHEKHPHAVG